MSHFNYQTMTAYRKSKGMRGYNPFDYPEEWEFFMHPFEADEEDDILTDFLFLIRKMTRRLHLYFDNSDYNRLGTAFYFGLLDSLSEVDDYFLGALKYARYCRLENLFFLTTNKDIAPFLEKLAKLQDELLSKIRSFGEDVVELNRECHEGNMFLHQYCDLTKHGISDDMLRALLRAPGFQIGLDKTLKMDQNANYWSYAENARVYSMCTEREQNTDGAYDSSKLNRLLEPVDLLLYYIRGTLLWIVIEKTLTVFLNIAVFSNRHDKLVETMCQDAYKEVCGAYARSRAYAKRRDEEFPQQCKEELFLQGSKPTVAEVQKYFNTHYRNFILSQNKCQQLYYQYRKQEDTFSIEFIKMLFNEDTREDAEDFLFFMTYSKDIRTLQTQSNGKKNKKIKTFREFIKDSRRTEEIIEKLHRLIGKKTNSDAIRIITRAWWIGWLDKKPTATSIRTEFPTITCSDSQISDILGEEKPTKNGKVDEEKIERIRKKYEDA